MDRATESVAYVTQAFRIQDASPPTQAEANVIQSRWVRWMYPNAVEDCGSGTEGSESESLQEGRRIPFWSRRPTVQDAWDLLARYMERDLLPVSKVCEVRHLAEGHFNTLFRVSHDPKLFAGSGRETLPETFVMRLKMPWCPYYGVESEAATLAFAGEEGIPVTKVFCFDSSTNNALGLNCIFMELIDVATNNWEEADEYLQRFDMQEYPRRLEPIARQAQEYMHRLAERRGSLDGIGSLYATFETGQRPKPVKLDFFLGPLLDWSLWAPCTGPEHCRGPFKHCFDYLDALVDAPDTRVDHGESKAWERDQSDQLPKLAKRHCMAKELVAASRARHEKDERAKKAVGTHTFETRLVHHDLHGGNIMVDAETGHVTMLLDWESADTRPAALTQGVLKLLVPLQNHSYWQVILDGNEKSKQTGLQHGWGPRDLGCYDNGLLATQARFVYEFGPKFLTWTGEEMKAVASHISTMERRGFHSYQHDCVRHVIQELVPRRIPIRTRGKTPLRPVAPDGS